MKHGTPSITRLVTGLVGALVFASEAMAASGSFLLIRRDLRVQTVEVAQIGERRLVFREDGGGWASVAIDRCVALLRTDAVIIPRHQGWLTLTDGQRFPGQALSGARVTEDAFVWNQSSWLGRMEVPLDHVASVVFDPGATVPPAGEQDVLLLVNGDRVEGFITALGDPVSLELLDDDGSTSIELPLGRVRAVRMVSPARRPGGQRLWLADGTIVDVERVVLGDDGYYRFKGVPFTEQNSVRIAPAGVAAVLFDPQALVPFASLRPRRVEGPPTRYVVPRPEVLGGPAALGLSKVEFRGPLAAHYVLPPGARYFAAEARLPEAARAWGDCVLKIRDNGREVFTGRLNAETPTVAIGVRLTGSMLTVEVTEGAGGPIQDHVVLVRAMILVEE